MTGVGRWQIFGSAAALLLTIPGGCAAPSRPPRADPAPAPVPPAPVVIRETIRLGESVEGRPIEMTVFRSPGPTAAPGAVLVIGGVHGNEPASVVVAAELARALAARPELAGGRTVAVLADANPDAAARRSRTNARGIDVNRNFPAGNYKTGPRPPPRGGKAAASEPETRAILAALDRTRPGLVISIHAIDDGRECNNYDGPGEAVARVMARHNGYPPAATIGYPTPGSLGSYAGADRGIPTITLELPRRLSGAKAWDGNRAALLAAIGGG